MYLLFVICPIKLRFMTHSRTLFQELTQQLRKAYAIEEAEAISYRLLSHYLQIERMDVILNKAITQTFDFSAAIKQLLAFEPIQYVLGQEEFMNMTFDVAKGVLIPRPETEELVQWIISDNTIDNPKILDIGTGSGCIPIALAKNIKGSEITSLDVSLEALSIAQRNAQKNEVDINFIHHNIFDSYHWENGFDIIVSNPPYVRESEKVMMNTNVLSYEPAQALFVTDDDPLIFYRRIMELATTLLNEEGKLYFEINEAFAQEMIDLSFGIGFDNMILKKDFMFKDRFFLIKKTSNATFKRYE